MTKFIINKYRKSYMISQFTSRSLKFKLRSHQFKCNIYKSNCPIPVKFCTEVQSQSNMAHMVKLGQLRLNMTI